MDDIVVSRVEAKGRYGLRYYSVTMVIWFLTQLHLLFPLLRSAVKRYIRKAGKS